MSRVKSDLLRFDDWTDPVPPVEDVVRFARWRRETMGF